jgi:prevent-host-death family protein
MSWPVQDAKQRFSELLRIAHEDGPQVVTRHGEEVAVVIDIADYHRLRGEIGDFKTFLTVGPAFDELELNRSAEPPRVVDLANEA